MYTNTVNVLVAAKDLLNIGWCKDVFARDANGYPVDVQDVAAVSFCAVGAIARVLDIHESDIYSIEFEKRKDIILIEKAFGVELLELAGKNNRAASKEYVLNLFDDAIKVAAEFELEFC